MKKQKIYIDTSVIGGVYDKEFEEYSKKLFLEIESDLKIAIISDITLTELENAPDPVKNVLKKIPNKNIEIITLTTEMTSLANQYLKADIITEKFREDALHIAIATVTQVDVLVSWNFKHIVNLKKIKGSNAINLKEGYSLLEIRSPKEVLENG